MNDAGIGLDRGNWPPVAPHRIVMRKRDELIVEIDWPDEAPERIRMIPVRQLAPDAERVDWTASSRRDQDTLIEKLGKASFSLGGDQFVDMIDVSKSRLWGQLRSSRQAQDRRDEVEWQEALGPVTPKRELPLLQALGLEPEPEPLAFHTMYPNGKMMPEAPLPRLPIGQYTSHVPYHARISDQGNLGGWLDAVPVSGPIDFSQMFSDPRAAILGFGSAVGGAFHAMQDIQAPNRHERRKAAKLRGREDRRQHVDRRELRRQRGW